MKRFEVVSINISAEKGTQKTPVPRATLKRDHGIVGDAHAGPWHRQVSLLAEEDIETMRARGATVGPGAFGENIVTRGIDLVALPLGARLEIAGVALEVTQKGKECHDRCAIYYQAGECIMPKRGIFVRVLGDGEIDRESLGGYDL